MKRLILTLQFFTRIPLPISLEVGEEDFPKGILYFPMVGLLIGAINGLVYLGASVIQKGGFPILCAVLANLLVTGALHLDGLADTCDGIFSARPKEKMLEIMRDSRIGTNGAAAVILDILFRVVLLMGMEQQHVFYMLLLAPAIGRTALVLWMHKARYARAGSGLGNLYIGKTTAGRVWITILLGMGITMIFMGIPGLIAGSASLVGAILYRRYIEAKIDGMTGDTLGAGLEIAEILFFIGIGSLGRVGML